MPRRPYDLPSPVSLQAFECAARHLSLKTAASELNVTPGAVSRQVKGLEDELGAKLFRRIHRGVELTPQGEDLFAVLSQGYDHTAQVVRRIREVSQGATVTLGSTTAFGQLWLMPRMGAFWQHHPEITVNHVLSDVDRDLVRAGVDLRTVYKATDAEGAGLARLFADTVIPVASPEFVETYPIAMLSELVSLPLLRVEGLDPDWITWEDWFDSAAIPHGRLQGRTFNNYAITLQAARDNQGIALGWRGFVDPLLRSGELVQVLDVEVSAPGAFYLSWNNERPMTDAALHLRDWIIDQARLPVS